MLHFFPTFSRNAADTPFGDALRETGVPHRIFAGEARFNYRTRAELIFVCIPRLAWFALRAGIKSLFLARPAPQAVVLGSDIEVVIFAVLRLLSLRWSTRIVLNGFIYTQRRSHLANALRRLMFHAILICTNLVIVYSRLEQQRYARLFPGVRFAFVPWGGSMNNRRLMIAEARPSDFPVLLTAGRSGRDYATLFQAMRGVPAALHVVCDMPSIIPTIPPDLNVTILTGIYGMDYMRALAAATIVVVPLAVEDISAGQMVVIQAFGVARPVIATRTPTICDYASDGETALLVPPNDIGALRAAIIHLLENPAERQRLGQAALAAYESGMDTPGHIRQLVGTVQSLVDGTLA